MSMRAPPPEFQRDLRATSLRLILLLGVASLFGSLISNGARSVTGPYLLLLGGSAAVVGLVAGAGEFIGYALIIAERIGKAIRGHRRGRRSSPMRRWPLGEGGGSGFTKRSIRSVRSRARWSWSSPWPSLGVIRMDSWFWPFLSSASRLLSSWPGRRCRHHGSWRWRRCRETTSLRSCPMPSSYSWEWPGLPPSRSYRSTLKPGRTVSDAAIPLFCAGAMVVSIFVALLLGRVFDREGVHIFLSIPIISLATVFLAFSNDPRIAVAGSLVWGAGIGLFEPLLQA